MENTGRQPGGLPHAFSYEEAYRLGLAGAQRPDLPPCPKPRPGGGDVSRMSDAEVLETTDDPPACQMDGKTAGAVFIITDDGLPKGR